MYIALCNECCALNWTIINRRMTLVSSRWHLMMPSNRQRLLVINTVCLSLHIYTADNDRGWVTSNRCNEKTAKTYFFESGFHSALDVVHFALHKRIYHSLGIGFGAECGQMGTFGRHSVSAESSRIPHSAHFRCRRAAVSKFGGCRK